MSTTITVWIQLYLGDVKIGDAFNVKPIPENVADLKKAVKEECKPKLDFCGANELKVYAAGTAVPGSAVTEALDPGDSVPTGTTSKTPLIVKAEQHQQSNGKYQLRCCFCILVFNLLFEYGNDCLLSYSHSLHH
jgi:hypothetical protein